MLSNLKKWSNSEVTVNCLWYYTLLALVVGNVLIGGLLWLI